MEEVLMKHMICSVSRLQIRFSMAFFLVIVFTSSLIHASEKGVPGKTPQPGLAPLTENGEMRLSLQDRCPVCAMLPAKSPKFASAIALKDGRTYYFCGTGCMIRAWMHPEVFLGADKNELKQSVVREYMGGEFVDGREAVWAAGSDVMGPMGPVLVPLKSETDLAAFKHRHGVKTTFRLDEMNDRLWEEITGKKP